MQIPNAGGDPLPMSDADARTERDRLGLQIVGPSYNSRKGITVKHITAGLKNRSLTGELGLRDFFMAAFQCLLFSNTDTKIRLDDVRYTQDIQNIGTRNWCKAVVDRLSVAAQLYKLDYAQKGINAPISGCTIFLVLSSSQTCIFSCSFLFHCFFFATVYILLLQSYIFFTVFQYGIAPFCNHLLPRFAIIFQITKSGFLFLQPHIIIVCNHTQNIVAITHWFSFFLSLLQSQK
jgi:hypothetical protein